MIAFVAASLQLIGGPAEALPLNAFEHDEESMVQIQMEPVDDSLSMEEQDQLAFLKELMG